MGTKDRIFDCALSLFSEHGFAGVSIRDIAKAVGINESSIYNHYEGKQAIIDEVCRRFASTLTVSRPALSEVNTWLDQMQPREIFKLLITSYGRQINPQITELARIVFSEQFHNETVRKFFMEEFVLNNSRYYADVLDLFEMKNKIIPCDKYVVANLFNNAQVALSIQYSHCKSEDECRQIAKMMLESTDFLIGSLEMER